jgi:hypothetical protein
VVRHPPTEVASHIWDVHPPSHAVRPTDDSGGPPDVSGRSSSPVRQMPASKVASEVLRTRVALALISVPTSVVRTSRMRDPNVGRDVPRVSESVENGGVPIPVRLVGRLLNRLCARSKRTAISDVGVSNIKIEH